MSKYDKATEGGHQQQPRTSKERVPFDEVVRCLGELLESGKIKVRCRGCGSQVACLTLARRRLGG